MSIEHSLIPAGEQHVVANWQVSTVPDLDNLVVTFDDIGKQAWVQGIGHFTLANSDPITWEASSAGIASFAYTAGTKVLTITDTAGATFTATVDGLSTAEVAALISAHAAASDPHGDRAFSIQRANHTGTQLAATISDFASAAVAAVPIPVTSVHSRTGAVVAGTGDYTVSQVTGAQSTANLSTDVNLAGGAGTYPNSVAAKAYADTKQPLDATLTALAGLNSTIGYVVQTGVDTFLKRSLSAGTGVSISNVSGLAGDSAISLAASGVTAGTYGSGSLVPVLVIDAYGRITGITTAALNPIFSDALFFIRHTADVTKRLQFNVSAIPTATDKLWTVPNANINFGDLSNVATTNTNTLGGTDCRIEGGTNNNVSGTGCETVNCFYTTLSGTRNTAINCGESGSAFTGSGTENTFINCRGATQGSGSVQCTFQDMWNVNPTMNNITFPSGSKVQGLNYAGYSADCSLQGIQSASTAVQCLSGGIAPWAFINQITGFEAGFHEIDIIAQETGTPYMAMLGRRHVTLLNNNSGGSVLTVATVGTDVVKNGAAYTITITESAGRLVITCNMTSSANTVLWRCRVRSTYQ